VVKPTQDLTEDAIRQMNNTGMSLDERVDDMLVDLEVSLFNSGLDCTADTPFDYVMTLVHESSSDRLATRWSCTSRAPAWSG